MIASSSTSSSPSAMGCPPPSVSSPSGSPASAPSSQAATATTVGTKAIASASDLKLNGGGTLSNLANGHSGPARVSDTSSILSSDNCSSSITSKTLQETPEAPELTGTTVSPENNEHSKMAVSAPTELDAANPANLAAPQSQPQEVGKSTSLPRQSFLPPITTHTAPSPLQQLISSQTWGNVSSRQPLGCLSNPPSRERLMEFAATLLEMRLVDVVRSRLEAGTLGKEGVCSQSHASSLNSLKSDDGDKASKGSMATELVNGAKWKSCGLEEHGHGADAHNEHSMAAAADHSSQSSTTPQILLTSTCRNQIRQFIQRIASMYRQNRYHGLEHAVHVAMSANKLLDMLQEGTALDSDVEDDGSDVELDHDGNAMDVTAGNVDKRLENGGAHSTKMNATHTSHSPPNKTCSTSPTTHPRHKRYKQSPHVSPYSLTTDPFTKFAFVFAAIIHDVDHQGVPNARLVQENDPIAELYDGVSIAEKHSIKVAFQVLNEDDNEGGFAELRGAIFNEGNNCDFEKYNIRGGDNKNVDHHESGGDELHDQLHMHRIVTNLVLSTDIASPQRMQCTKLRWEEAFLQGDVQSTAAAGGGKGGGAKDQLQMNKLSIKGQGPSEEVATVIASEPRIVSLQHPTNNNTSSSSSSGGGDEGDSSPTPSSSSTSSTNPNSGTASSSSLDQSRKRTLQLTNGQTLSYFSPNSNPSSQNSAHHAHLAKLALRHSVIIETMLNVADVAHAMQSWPLFKFWNRKLFEELYDAYQEGRSENDPGKGGSEEGIKGWYENQLFFYKIYILPLAEKMRVCRVFDRHDQQEGGNGCDEGDSDDNGGGGGQFLRNAILIRDRWEREGEVVTKNMIEEVQREYSEKRGEVGGLNGEKGNEQVVKMDTTGSS